MAFLYVVEFLISGVIIFIAATQIIWPLWTGRPLFYSWRRSKAEEKISVAQEELDLRLLKEAEQKLRKRINPIDEE